ncbi:MAG: alanine racemase [Anaerolineales bacterium]|nr:alanine racemase [Anaerolineales bacterium]
MTFTNERYQTLRDIFRGKRLPLAFVDLDAFDANVAYAAGKACGTGKTIRLGSKSIRCEPLMRRILEYSDIYRGFLTYTVEETKFLADKGHDNFIVAYPTIQPSDIELIIRLARDGKSASVMVDSLQHLTILSAAGEGAGVAFSACLEVDLSYRPLGTDKVHLGLRRSPVRTPEQALELAKQAQALEGVQIDCLMGYEGHIAGVNDDVPGQALNNFVMRTLKNMSVKELTSRRGAVVRSLKEAGVKLRLVNGGGSGSLVSTLADESVTEVTVGSGFYAPGLFHHFNEVQYQPSAFFALQVVRVPKPGMVTCQGGGYIASGPIEASKAPLPVMPVGMSYLPLEGAGEVQTPLQLADGTPEIALGDPVFFQHAKAGELCERFNELYLLRGKKIVDVVKTYRGEGMNFL